MLMHLLVVVVAAPERERSHAHAQSLSTHTHTHTHTPQLGALKMRQTLKMIVIIRHPRRQMGVRVCVPLLLANFFATPQKAHKTRKL